MSCSGSMRFTRYGGEAMQPLSSSEISARIEKVDSAIVALEGKVSQLSLGAISGNEADSSALDEAQQHIRTKQGERETLVAALKAARQREARTVSACEQAKHEQHLNNAHGALSQLLDLAQRADAMVAEYRALHAEIRETGRLLVSEARKAKQFRDGIVGSRGVSEIFEGHIETALKPDAFRPKRTISEMVGNAWSHLGAEDA